MTRTVIAPGIALNCVTTGQFKTNVLTLYFLRRLDAAEAALNALLPSVMRRGNAKYPDLKAMSDALADLYGASLIPSVVKRGELHCFGLASTFISESLDGVAGLMLDTVFEPVLSHYTESERGNLITRIRSAKNDKTSYAVQRLDALACEGTPYAVARLGGEESAAAITKPLLEQHYLEVLKTSRVEIFYCGTAEPERIKAILLPRFEAANRNYSDFPKCENDILRNEPRYFTEHEDVEQAKLAIMWRGGEYENLRDFISAYTASVIYGGGAGKLFENVRERLSLCYYANAQLDRYKSVIKASSGVEAANIDRARDEMLAQWNAVTAGDFSDDDIAHAKASMLNAWLSAADSPAGLETFWQGQAASERAESLEDWSAELETVGKQDIVGAASGFTLDAVYCMRAKE